MATQKSKPKNRINKQREIEQRKRKRRKKALTLIVLIIVLVCIGTYLLTSPTFKIQEIIDNNNDEVNVIVCSAKVKRDYMQYMSEHRQNIEIIECDGGFKCLQFNNYLLMVQAKIPDNEIYLLNTEDFKLHQLCDWEWISDENNKILKQHPTKPVYTARLVKYANYICHQPQKQIKVVIGENNVKD